MFTPDKTLDTRPRLHATTPTVYEALEVARTLPFELVDPEEQLHSLSRLNSMAENAIGSVCMTDAGYSYYAQPHGGLKRHEVSTATFDSHYYGKFSGFHGIPLDPEADTESTDVISDSTQLAVKMFMGEGAVSTEFTDITYQLNAFFPVSIIRSIDVDSELAIMFSSAEKLEGTVNKEDVFEQLIETMQKVREALKGLSVYNPLQVIDVEPWDYDHPTDISLGDYRHLHVGVLTDRAIICNDSEEDEPTLTPASDFSFQGYYVGVVGFEGKKGHYKPHFAFELSQTSDESVLETVQYERCMPIVYVPISDHVRLDVEIADE